VEFRKRFDKQFPEYGRPVIIRGALNKWTAMNNWKFDQLVAKFKTQMFKVRTPKIYPHRSSSITCNDVPFIRLANIIDMEKELK